MAQLRDIKRHIGSINKIKQITKAMYAISMTRVMKAKQQLNRAKAYQRAQRALLDGVIGSVDGAHPLLKSWGEGRFVFAVNSDRGLCGRFKGDVNRGAEKLLKEDPSAKLIVGGEKALIYFRKSDVPIEARYVGLYDQPQFEHAQQIADDLLALYRQTGTPIDMVFMRFENDFRQRVEVERLLPLAPSADEGESAVETDEEAEELRYLYEPSQQEVFEAVVPMYLKAQVYRTLLESKTSEHAIRRQAMRSATDNAEELIESLTIEYNKARQESITRQLLDIMGGAEALKG